MVSRRNNSGFSFTASLAGAKEPPEEGRGTFQATMEDGEVIQAANVVLAIGVGPFKNLPLELERLLPSGRFSHTCDLVDFSGLKDKWCPIIAGRQSAFESAALIREAGAAGIHLSYRHETPSFEESDWTWVNGLLEGIIEDPEWYGDLPPAEKEAVDQRFWAVGRLKLEPWIWPRIDHDSVQMWPQSQVSNCREMPSGELAISLDSGDQFVVDQVLLATGYRVNLDRVPFLTQGNLPPRLETNRGFPVLDGTFQSSVQGLYFTSMAATGDYRGGVCQAWIEIGISVGTTTSSFFFDTASVDQMRPPEWKR